MMAHRPGTLISGKLARAWGVIAFRFMVVAAIVVWMGGFTFYGAIVIPTAHQVLGTHLDVGFITQQVSHWLNLGGALTSLLLLANLLGADRSRRMLVSGMVATWMFITAAQVALFVMHPNLDVLLDAERHAITDREQFHQMHRIYLLTATFQWCAAVVHVIFLLVDWRCRDSKQIVLGPVAER